ncbi:MULTISPECIES: ribulose-phosphate 3-epimerase [unclassified Halorhabdus]|uniref:ribulose-phosphate 3-epimerase n=1 Tax=unclassified Halorhabdus TaxID=2621901 RepID=UPI0023D9C4F6|nr:MULTISPECIES: ribulose-phosphate 3-epimerase [unclassified Halorhabdus]WEL16962.1 Ribulose-phosphate 3-epimerase [Halorhabdus sp. SVX81]WEL20840.1 Ribulose-phosphate 3-epimerase [Halorhabdus sp. BNX81]
MCRIAPSILAADFADLYGDVSDVESAEILHLDVMDGHFVPNISFGPPVISSLRDRTDLYFDTHLMIEHPGEYVEAFQDAGADRLTVHVESEDDPGAVIESIHDHGMDAGIALNPDTDVEAVEPYLDDVEVVLVMSVQPGFGGQSFMPETLDRIERLDAMGAPEIEVDGGVNSETGPQCVESGVDTLVIGSSLFGQSDVAGALADLRESVGIEAKSQ